MHRLRPLVLSIYLRKIQMKREFTRISFTQLKWKWNEIKWNWFTALGASANIRWEKFIIFKMENVNIDWYFQMMIKYLKLKINSVSTFTKYVNPGNVASSNIADSLLCDHQYSNWFVAIHTKLPTVYVYVLNKDPENWRSTRGC